MKYDSAVQIFEALPRKFSREAAGDLNAVFQFDIAGDQPSQWSVSVANGRCEVQRATHPAPSVTLRLSEDTWLRVVGGELSALSAFMSGRIRAQGNVMLAQRLGQVFGLSV